NPCYTHQRFEHTRRPETPSVKIISLRLQRAAHTAISQGPYKQFYIMSSLFFCATPCQDTYLADQAVTPWSARISRPGYERRRLEAFFRLDPKIGLLYKHSMQHSERGSAACDK